MKRFLAASAFAACLAFTATSFAREGDQSVEGTLNYGTEAGYLSLGIGMAYHFR